MYTICIVSQTAYSLIQKPKLIAWYPTLRGNANGTGQFL